MPEFAGADNCSEEPIEPLELPELLHPLAMLFGDGEVLLGSEPIVR
jgi:hypothetical protein